MKNQNTDQPQKSEKTSVKEEAQSNQQNASQKIHDISEASSNNQNTSQQVNGALEELQAEVNKWKTDYLYLRAEFDNYRKNVLKERSELTKYGAEKFIHDFLEIVDTMEKAMSIKPTPENLQSYAQGVQLIMKEIKSLLQKHGVVPEDCLKKPFDPTRHEALGSEISEEVPPGFITRVIKFPYRYHEKLLRPGQVMVAADPNHKK